MPNPFKKMFQGKWRKDVTASLDRVENLIKQLASRMEQLAFAEKAREEKLIMREQEILDRVRAQTTVIESVRVLVQALKDAADDPVKTAEIIAALDANDVALAMVANTPAQ